MTTMVGETTSSLISKSVTKLQRLVVGCLVCILAGIALALTPQEMIAESTKLALFAMLSVFALACLILASRATKQISSQGMDVSPVEKSRTAEPQTSQHAIKRLGFKQENQTAQDAAEQLCEETIVSDGDHGSSQGGELSFTDPLTKLGNRARLMDKFEKLVGSSPETAEFSVGILDLDGMKPINDLFGYKGGDEVLKQCALRLSNSVEGDGFVMRNDGDEFAFIFPNVKTEEEALIRGKLLQEVLQAPFDLEGSTVRLSGSFGFGLLPHAGTEFAKVMENISSALYHSKRGGRGRVTVFSKEIEDLMLENARIEQALRRAIANNEVKPHYQPIISLQDGKLLGFEALARWIDKDLGFVSPAKFIPLAEERGIIAPLTEKLLLQAATTAASWPENMFLSFNLSSSQLVDPTTADTILAVIKRAGLRPTQLEIEVTETAVMSDPETAEQIIEQLHQNGIRISMDDFGTGQSSLGRLREMKLDKVKIDRAFIMAIGEDKPAEHIVRAILEMCAGLDLTVVAEGIEEIEQAESLKKYGCHAGQGYLFGKPQDEHKTMGYIREFIGEENLAMPDMQAAS